MEYGEYICEAYLKSQRRWTNALIRDFLDGPDKTIPNPRCPTRGKRDMKLYLLGKIKDLEMTPYFQEAFFKAQKRSEAHRRVSKNN